VQRLAEFEHDVICRVDDIVDGSLFERFQAAAYRVRRRAHVNAADNPRGVPRAQIGALNIHARGAGRRLCRFGELHGDGAQLAADQRRGLARHSVVSQAIGPVNGQVHVEERAGGRLRDTLDGDAGHGKPCTQLLRRKVHIDELFEPVVENFHRVSQLGAWDTASGELAQEAHVVLKEELHIVDAVLELRQAVHA
jgi:hypothetical protein